MKLRKMISLPFMTQLWTNFATSRIQKTNKNDLFSNVDTKLYFGIFNVLLKVSLNSRKNKETKITKNIHFYHPLLFVSLHSS